MRILKHHTQRPAQGILLDVPDVDAVVGDGAGLDFVEPVDKAGDGCLTCAGGTYKGNFLAWLGKEGNVMEDDNIFMCEYMTGLPTLAKVKKGDTQLDIEVEKLLGLYE